MSENTAAAKKSTRPAKAEVEGTDEIEFTVNVKGKEITIVCPSDITDAPIEVAEAFEDGKNLKAFMGLIGEAQAAKLRAAGLTTRIFADEVIPAWQEAAGLGKAKIPAPDQGI